jgi:hypothetical protein
VEKINIEEYEIVEGVGNRESHELCVMSLAALLAGAPHGDEVPCACRVVRAFAIRLNDSLPRDARQALKVVAPEILNTRGSRALETRRAFRCADWAVREVAAGALVAAELVENALALRGLDPVVDEATARAARDLARTAAAAADAAYYAYAAAAAAYAAYAAAAAAYAAYAANAAAYAANAADYAAYAAAAAAYAAYAARTVIHERSIAFLRDLCAMKDEA